MPLIWSAISAHGYGHAAQVIPVLNALGRRRPGIRAVLRTNVPRAFFSDRLTVEWEVSPCEQDIGCIQEGPITMDWPATWQAHRTFHTTWDRRLRDEVEAIKQARADLVLGNIPYLAMAAGAAVGLPTIAVASLSWDDVLQEHLSPDEPWQQSLLNQIGHSYAQATLLLRIAPGLPMRSFPTAADISPIAAPRPPERTRLRERLQIGPQDALVLVAFGGIRLQSLPFAQMESMAGLQFLIDGPVPPGFSHIHSLAGIPLPFSTLLSSVDAVITKPGYGTTIESVAVNTPVIYVRRYNFADEQPIVEYLHRYGRGVELTREDFEQARWETALHAALALPQPIHQPPDATGAIEAAKMLELLLPV